MTRQNKKMSLDVSVRLRYLHQDKGGKISDLVKGFTNYLKSNIYILLKLPDKVAKTDGRKLNKGRPKVLTVRNERKIIRTMLILREFLGSLVLSD